MKEFFITFGLMLVGILAPIQAFIVTISLFVVADTVFGIYAAIKIGGVVAFRSNLLFNTVIKTFFYMAVILLGYALDKVIFEGSIMGISLLISKTLTLLFSYIEIKSLDETSIKLGNHSLWIHIKQMFAKGKEFKKDLGMIISNEEIQELQEEIKVELTIEKVEGEDKKEE